MSIQYVIDRHPAYLPWSLVRGDSDSFDVPIEQRQPDGTYLPLNLTNYTVTVHIVHTNEMTGEVLTLTDGNGLTVDAVAGQITIELSAAQSAAFDRDEYEWTLVLTKPDVPSYRKTFVKSPLTIL